MLFRSHILKKPKPGIVVVGSCLVVAALVVGGRALQSQTPAPDVILVNAKIYTVDQAFSTAEAVANAQLAQARALATVYAQGTVVSRQTEVAFATRAAAVTCTRAGCNPPQRHEV